MANLTLEDYKKKILKNLNDYDSTVSGFTDDEDLKARFNDVINEAVRFAFYGKAVPENWNIVQGKSANKITTQDDVYTSMGYDIEFTVDEAFAYNFEVDDACTVTISQAGVDLVTITHAAQTGARTFTAYKGAIAGAAADTQTTMKFAGGTYYNFRNVALYGVSFSAAGRIPAFDVWNAYAIPANLYKVLRAFDKDAMPVDYRIVGGDLLLRYDTIGEITVESIYFPDAITEDTIDSTEIDVPYELQDVIVDRACALITRPNQKYGDYIAHSEQKMAMLESREGVASARAVKFYDID